MYNSTAVVVVFYPAAENFFSIFIYQSYNDYNIIKCKLCYK